MAGAILPREQALPLLAAVNNHCDLAVKLSSLKQVKDILLTIDPSHAAELFPYLAELQSSPETLVRKYLLEVIDEIGANSLEHVTQLLPVLVAFLKDRNPVISKQAVIVGTNFFKKILEEMSFQFQQRGFVERWLEQSWTWMLKFRDAVLSLIFEAGAIGPKFLALKFLETYILYFSLDPNNSERRSREVSARHRKVFNLSWIIGGHPVLNPTSLASDGSRYLGILLDMLRSPSNFPGSLTISAVNSVAAIGRKRPVFYKSVLNALLEFNPNFETSTGCHTPSIQYSLRTAFLGFLRCSSHPVVAESRETLLKVLRAMNAGDAADQVIRQLDKIMRNNERASRDQRMCKDDVVSNQLYISGDVTKKRSAPPEKEDHISSFDVHSKRLRYGPHENKMTSVAVDDAVPDRGNGISSKPQVMNGELTPVEQMISMVGALIAEGERGAASIGVLIANMHIDLLAEIVITNIQHLAIEDFSKYIPPSTGHVTFHSSRTGGDLGKPEQVVVPNGSATSAKNLGIAVELPIPSSNLTSVPPLPDISSSSNLSTDIKRDPRRDPRRLDPRRAVVPVDVPSASVAEENVSSVQHYAVQSDDASRFISPLPPLVQSRSQSISVSPRLITEPDLNISELPMTAQTDLPVSRDEDLELESRETPDTETDNVSLLSQLSVGRVKDAIWQPAPIDVAMLDEVYSSSSEDTDQHISDTNIEASEIASSDLPAFSQYVELSEDRQRILRKQALERIVNLYQSLQKTECKQTQMTLVARLFGQTDLQDVVQLVCKHIVLDCEQQKGHELVMHILYHLRGLAISDSVSSAASIYDDFLLRVANSLLDDLPPSDKSFVRLLGEVPHVPDPVLRLLEDICTENQSGADGRDGDRVIQGLGAVWSLLVVRPLNRQACLDIALKCAIHPKDDIRGKAIRLVSNKLYVISSISENIEKFATDMFLSCAVPHANRVLSQTSASENRQVESQETSTSGSQVSEPPISQNDTVNDSSVTFAEAVRQISLLFSLCTKKRSLLQLVFDNYAHAPKASKQAVHHHIPNLIRTLGSSCSELLNIISSPPPGSEHLVIQVLDVLCEGTIPSPELVATVKHLYETRLKDATILIPILSAFTRDEVLPIFPQLVKLPLDKFQIALAHILQGSALTGPALTPAEVLVAIHDISPDKDSLPLKKITDACSACFEQRTVFTQSVLSKALSQMVERTPLPLLFMRTVIQAIDAFPTLVNVVMEILSKLVQRQIWRSPKLWVGVLKCISQTQPHSFSVLLQLPSPQLESALNKYPNLRGPLTAYVNQYSAKTSLPRSILIVLGLASEEPTSRS